MLSYFPKYFTSKAISLYFGVLLLSNIIFINHVLNYKWWIFGIIEAVSFFYFANHLTRKWFGFSEKRFIKKLFVSAFLVRVIWVVISYFFYMSVTGTPFEYDSADAKAYHTEATELSAQLREGDISPYLRMINGPKRGPSDDGYPIYLGVQYFITNDSIIIERIIKSILGAITCVLLYKFAKRNFGEETGRMSAIFCFLMPNMILYSGIHTKEVEMVFLTVWFMERADNMLRSGKFSIGEITPPVLLATSLFFFRTILGATAVFALFTSIVFTPSKVMNTGKRVTLFIWLIGALSFVIGGTISNEVEAVWVARDKNQQQSMEFRSTRDNGNKFAKYLGAGVFAPMIFVIPFPTMVETPQQENQKIINGGNFAKNILGFFIIYAFIYIIKQRKWKDFLLIEAFTVSYLVVLAMSAFAQSERFHQPALPFELVLAAFGISLITNTQKKYYTWWLAFMFIAMMGWGWFKLAGRNMA